MQIYCVIKPGELSSTHPILCRIRSSEAHILSYYYQLSYYIYLFHIMSIKEAIIVV